MSFDDDRCDFCGTYIDPIGGDTAKRLRQGFWCGRCRGGRNALFGPLSDTELTAKAAELQAAYEADPIDWNKYPEDDTREAWRRHLRRLKLMDLAASARQALHDRQAGDT